MMTSTEQEQEHNNRRTLVGKVVSDACNKTIVVMVVRQVPHKLYKKYITRSKKYHAHDETNSAGVGDTVRIEESRPYSKLKTWVLADIIEKAK
jgi:small subunit ribosomal protein S17